MRFCIICVVTLISFLLAGCEGKLPQKEKNKYNSVYYVNGKEEYYYYEDILDIKPKVRLDSSKLLQELDLLFLSKKLTASIQPGYNNFYLMLMIGNSISYKFNQYIYLMTDIGYIMSHEDSNYIVDYTLHGRQIKIAVFQRVFNDNKGIFQAEKGKLENETVPSLKLYEIGIHISDEGEKISQWKISEFDIDKMRPKMAGDNDMKNFKYKGEFLKQPVIEGGFETIKSKINYPLDAQNKSINGKILVKAYINENGNVVGTQLLKGLGYGCDEEVKKAVMATKFMLIEKDKYQADIPFFFDLKREKHYIDLTSTKFVSEPKEIKADKEVTFNFNIVNLGDKIADSQKGYYKRFRYSFFIEDKLHSSAEFPIKEIFPANIFTKWKCKHKGVYRYKLYIDPDNVLQEKNRENNLIQGTFEVK